MLDLISCADGHNCPQRGRCERWTQRATSPCRDFAPYNARRPPGGECPAFIKSVGPVPDFSSFAGQK